MSRNRHGPSGSCSCCSPPCYINCPNGTAEVITEVEWDITFPSELTIWQFYPGSSFFAGYWVKSVYTGLTVLNGTYIVSLNTSTCSWQIYQGSETVSATHYTYNDELLVDSGGEEYHCPNLSGYVGTATTSDVNVSIFANPYSIGFNFTGVQVLSFFSVGFDGYAKGSNNNSPCESATLNWNSLDAYPVDTRCSGISNQVVTAVLTPTII